MNTPATSRRLASWLEQAWLTRFLDRQLSAEETAWFEAYALDKPDLLMAIDGDTDLRDALQLNRGLAGEDSRVGGATIADIGRTRNQKRVRPRGLALAASVFVGAGVGAIGFSALNGSGSAPDVIVAPTTIVYQTMRSTSAEDRQVQFAEGKSAYVLYEVAVPVDAQNVTLQVDGSEERQIPVSPDGFVSFLVRRKTGESRHVAKVRFNLDRQPIQQQLSLDPR